LTGIDKSPGHEIKLGIKTVEFDRDEHVIPAYAGAPKSAIDDSDTLLDEDDPAEHLVEIDGIKELGGYFLKSKIGHGGMGVVYLAIDPSTGRRVALKVIASHRLTDDDQRRRFVLTYVQPGLAGLMDGSVSTLAPIFATAFATQDTWTTFLVGLAASVGARPPPSSSTPGSSRSTRRARPMASTTW